MASPLTSGIWNNTSAPASASAPGISLGAKPMAASSSSDTNDTNQATITANDFLTLLVTEMQNQDPTADTDPNEYINQLVNVNSLEQLIQINQTLSGAASGTADVSGTHSPNSDSGSSSQAVQGTAASQANAAAHAYSQNSNQFSGHVPGQIPGAAQSSASGAASPSVAEGNYGVPNTSRAALRVSRALEAPRITR